MTGDWGRGRGRSAPRAADGNIRERRLRRLGPGARKKAAAGRKHGRAQRSGDMGIIGRDGQKFSLQGEGGILPCGSSGGKPPHYGRAPPRRGLSRTRIYPGRGNPSKFWVAGADGYRSGLSAPAQGK